MRILWADLSGAGIPSLATSVEVVTDSVVSDSSTGSGPISFVTNQLRAGSSRRQAVCAPVTQQMRGRRREATPLPITAGYRCLTDASQS